jgi:hypothetical protein
MFEVFFARIQEGFLHLGHDAHRLRAIGPADVAIFVADFPANAYRESKGWERKGRERETKGEAYLPINRVKKNLP